MSTIILAIESSCDETGAAIMKDGKLLSNIIATQSIHENYGGVVPELASRAHQKNIVPTVHKAFQDANIGRKDLSAVAFTQGPGLLGALLVGNSFAKGLSLALQVPLIGVNHMQAHILAHFITPPYPSFPFLCLTVSGGHTQLVLIKDYLDMEVIGQTQDDAVGEAFDKAAKILGLPYPGGPLIDRYAQKGNATAFSFPDTSMAGLDFSFSGIKTAFLYFIRDKKLDNPDFVEENLHDICASIQDTLINMLLGKLKTAVKETGIKEVAIAGGVSANSALRSLLLSIGKANRWRIHIPALAYCTDNAAMVAMAAHYKLQYQQTAALSVTPIPRMAF